MGRADSPLRGRLIFNVGARRSGTMWLQRIVTSHPAVSGVPSETHLFSHGLAPLRERFHHSIRSSPQVGSVYVEREVLLDSLRDLCDAVFAGFLEPGTERIAERTALHARHLDLIGEVYPDARVVHLVRDGRDVARSLASRDFGADSIAATAEEWRDTVAAARGAGLGQDRLFELRYERLLAEPRERIAELFDWLELSAEPATLDRAIAEAEIPLNFDPLKPSAASGKWREELDATALCEFDRVAGGLLDELGYEPSPSAGAPRRPRRPARGSGRGIGGAATLGRSVRRRLSSSRSGGAPAERPDTERWRMLQTRIDEAVEALLDGDAATLAELCTDGARFSVVEASGRRAGRGEEGLAMLAGALAERRPFSGEQARGEVFVGIPISCALLSYGGPSGGDRVVVLTSRDGVRFEEVALYRFPLAAPSATG